MNNIKLKALTRVSNILESNDIKDITTYFQGLFVPLEKMLTEADIGHDVISELEVLRNVLNKRLPELQTEAFEKLKNAMAEQE